MMICVEIYFELWFVSIFKGVIIINIDPLLIYNKQFESYDKLFDDVIKI
jgi:ssDNA-specific exonuclease RecJ